MEDQARAWFSSREQELLRPQLLDRIAQLRGFLEFELLGRFAHVAFEFLDIRVYFLLRLEFRDAFGFPRCHTCIVGCYDPSKRHVERTDDRLRRYAVLFV